MPNFQAMAMQYTVLATLWEVVTFGIAMAVMYFVVKAAVKDGINESRLGSERARATAERRRDTRNGDTLPPMHAD
jgi:MFS superfamily sulfate permease-like transporter